MLKSQETFGIATRHLHYWSRRRLTLWRTSILTVALDLDFILTAVKCNVIVLCNPHTREMLLSLPAAAAACCSSVLLLCHCSAAQVQLVWLCNHWVRLHCCTLPVLLLKLLLTLSSSSMAWLGLKSSNFLCLLS